MPVRVLCLHGCCQSEEMLRSLLKTWIKFGERDYDLEFHFLQATTPHSDGGWTWYEDELDVSRIGTIEYAEELCGPCIDRVRAYVIKNKIDVLLGFSQGGNVVDTYLWKYDLCAPIKRALILSGYELLFNACGAPNNDGHHPPLATPVLSVYSEADEVVPAKFRPAHYLELTELTHDKGHKFPSGNRLIKALCAYLQTGEFTPPPPPG